MKFLNVLATVSKYITTASKYLKLVGVATRTLEFFNEELKREFPDGFTTEPNRSTFTRAAEQQSDERNVQPVQLVERADRD